MKFPIQPDNPILQRELLHQKRRISPWIWRIELIGVVSIPLIASLVLIMNSLRMDDYFSYYTGYLPPRYTTLQILLPLIWSIHALTAIRAIMAGAHAMSRDYQQGVWDELQLTGIMARQLLIGKWWAALHRIRGWMVALGLLHILIIPIFMAEFTFNSVGKEFGQINYCFIRYAPSSLNECMSNNVYPARILMWPDWKLPGGIAIAIALSFLEAVSSTAVGLAAGVIVRSETLAATLGIVIRFLPVLIFSFFPDYPNTSGAFLWRWHEYTWFALADGGTSAVMRIIAPVYFNRELQATLAAGGLLLVFLIGAIAIVLIALRRNGISWRS